MVRMVLAERLGGDSYGSSGPLGQIIFSRSEAPEIQTIFSRSEAPEIQTIFSESFTPPNTWK